jgi:hypothetical protein
MRVGLIEAPAAPAAAVLGGLDPGRLGMVARAAALAELASAAGNDAVASLVTRSRTDLPLDPPGGVREVRRIGGGATLGHTRLSMDPSPPLFRPAAPAQVGDRFGVKPMPTRAPEMHFDVRYPAPGRHLMYEGTTDRGEPARVWLEVSADWSARLLEGEEEHVADQTIAGRDTWQRIAGVLNDMASGPPVCRPTAAEATNAAWHTFVDALPAPLRPSGAEPSEEAQVERWGFAESTSLFRRLVDESGRARDRSGWHTTGSSLDHMEGVDEVREVVAGSSKIGVTSPEDLMTAAWTRLSGKGGGRK